jgi:outer membrane protein TolC
LSLVYGYRTARVPVVPTGVPSQLLLSNPAVAALRTMASTNAEIGVAEAAWFPSLTLSGSDDFDSAALSTLIRASNAVWSFGPSFAENLFNGGATLARIREARATYDEAVADYRQTVLSTFEQVENDLATLRYLQVEYGEQLQAVADAKRAEHLTFNQYKAGTADYATLLSAQTAELSDGVTLVNLQSQRLVASVDLIHPLGGGCNGADLDRVNDGIRATLSSTVALPPMK